MKTAALVLHKGSLSIYKKELDDAGFTYTECGRLDKDSLVLKVDYDMVATIKTRRVMT